MRKWRLRFNVFAVVFLALTVNSLAHAQATRTWVSGVGDDVNPCSRTAPCKTFAGAISKTAAGGEINVLDAGGFGAVTITKSITIDGGESFASILSFGTNGIVINALGATVRIRNLEINGAGAGINGIRYLAASTVHIENVHIYGFTTHGIDVNTTAAGVLMVHNATITNCGGSGINMTSTVLTAAVIDRVRIHKCAMGVKASSNSRATVRDSDVSLNATGILAEQPSGTTEVNVINVLAVYCTAGLQTAAGNASLIMRITDSTVMNNGTGLSVGAGSQVISGQGNAVFHKVTDGAPTSTVPKI